MKNKKGFTLVEIIAAIAIMTIIGLIAVPSVIKKFNTSRIQAMTIQENKLVEAGDILLDDYCRDAIDEKKKKRCKFYYQELALSDAEKLSYSEIVKDDKIYKYICVKDIKDLDYYSEELVYSGTPCQGVVVYEIDKKSNMKSDAYSYVKCEDAYRTQEKNIKIEELFKNCFDGSDASDREETYTVTVKHVENHLGGMEISPRKTFTVRESKLIDDNNDEVLFSIETILHTRNGNTYSAVLNKGGKNIDYSKRTVDNKSVYDITGLPTENITINIVYSVEKHAIVTNFYKFAPGKASNEKSHNGVLMEGIEEQKISGFTFETMRVDFPETLNQTVGGRTEEYNLVEAWVDNEKKTLPFDGNVDVGQVDKKVDLVYQQEEFNVTYNNKGGTGCTTGRVKYNKKWNLCTPTKPGYTFDGWSLTDGGDKINTNDINTHYSDLNLYARWNVNNYKIQYVLNDGSNPSGPTSVAYDQVFNLANPTKEAYTFTGWTVSGANASTAKHGTSSSNVNSAISNSSTKIKSTYFKNLTSTNNAIVTMTANYEINAYNISFDCNGGTGSTAAMNNISYGSTVNLSANGCSRTGYNFGGWTGSNGKTYSDKQSVSDLSTTSGETIVMKAIWNIKTFTITYKLGDVQMASTGSSAPLSAGYNKTVTVSNPTAPGFTFMGWTVSGTGASISGTTLKMGSANVTLTANWEANLSDYVTFLGNNYAESNSMKKDSTSDQNVRYYHRTPNNYVKFNNELWRIIGVFNVSDGSSTSKRVKLIRETSLIHASWDSSSSSINSGKGVDEWSQADLKVLLNDYYFNGTGSCKYCNGSGQSSCSKTCSFSPMTAEAKSMVGNAVWYLGGLEYGGDDGDGTQTAKEAYNIERGGRSSKPYCKSKNPNSGHCSDSVTRTGSWTGAVGLIYVSDFGYASGKSACYDVDVTYNSDCGRNWMYPSDEEESYWTITHRHSNWFGDAVHRVLTWTMGDATTDGVTGVRPSVYLKRSVKVVNGNGSIEKPYILK